MSTHRSRLPAGIGLVSLLALLSSPGLAQILGTAENFAVLAGSTVTNTGASVVVGDLGVSPGSAITGFPPGVVVGTQHPADPTSAQAQVDLTAAYNTLAGLPCDTVLTGQNLGGLVLAPGVYCFATSAQLTGTLTLTGNGQHIFQIGSTLTTASDSIMTLTNGALACDVYWQVGSSAVFGTNSAVLGNFVVLTSITATTGSSVSGRVLSRNGATTLDTNNVAVCIIPNTPTPIPNTPTPSNTPTPTPTLLPGAPTPTPTPFVVAPVPTLSGWAMLTLSALLALAGFWAIRR